MLTATELTIAARMYGMSYGKYTYLLRQDMIKLPPIELIRAQMVTKESKESRRVVQYNFKGEYMATYESCADAAVAIGKERRKGGVIRNACTGKTNSAFGYQWRFEGEKEPGIYMNRGEMPIRKTKLVEKVCVRCGKEYKGVGRSLYCSGECAKAAQKESTKRYYEKNKQPPEERQLICKHCGKPFTATHGRAVFCSDRCRIDNSWMAQRDRKKAQNRKESA